MLGTFKNCLIKETALKLNVCLMKQIIAKKTSWSLIKEAALFLIKLHEVFIAIFYFLIKLHEVSVLFFN